MGVPLVDNWAAVKYNSFMKIDVKKIAKLARLTIADDQFPKLEKELSAIISYVDTLQKLDTSSVIPTNQVTGLTHVVRHDRVEYDTILTPDAALSNAPQAKDDYFVVKAVFENND